MKDFNFLSDSDESAAVDELLSQANDLSVLEQVAAINCSGVTDSVLPSDLETRFRKLKTFPASKNPNPKPSPRSAPDSPTPQPPRSLSDEEALSFSASKQHLREKGGSSSSNSSRQREIPDDSKSKSKPRSPSFSPPQSSSSDSSRNASPSRKGGCLWCSPRRVSRKKSKESRIAARIDWDKNSEEFLASLGSFSGKEQKKLMKKAAEEEEKISREAEKIVKWAKQASARMNISEDELSDTE